MPMGRLFVAGVIATIFLSQAQAAQINPQCKVMGTSLEQIACTCALEHGGWIRHIHGIWRYNYANPHMNAVHACVKAAGG